MENASTKHNPDGIEAAWNFPIHPSSAFLEADGCAQLAVPLNHQHVLFWGGLRGALTLALVLAVPANMPERSQIVVTAFAVVAFSIFVKGITMPRLVRELGLLEGDIAKSEPAAAE